MSGTKVYVGTLDATYCAMIRRMLNAARVGEWSFCMYSAVCHGKLLLLYYIA